MCNCFTALSPYVTISRLIFIKSLSGPVTPRPYPPLERELGQFNQHARVANGS